MTHAIRWTAEKISQRLALIEPLVYRRRAELPPFRYLTLPNPSTEPLVAPEVDDSQWPVIEPNTHWGRPFTDFMLRSTFRIPADWDAAEPMALYLPLGDAANFSHPEALAYVDGQAYAGVDRHHREIRLRPEWHDGRSHALALHGWTGLGEGFTGDSVTRLIMRPGAVVQIDLTTRDFLVLARVALGTSQALDAHAPARGALLNALNAAFSILDTREPFGDAFYASVAPALAALRAGIEKAGPPMAVGLTGTGHAHIDVAWLWTLDQTRRKAGRTFHTALRLMEEFPEYHFTQSQPQLYDYVRQDYPELFEAIKARVAERRWEPIGGMWVEADCNITGAESLARQFLLGRTFFREHFGPDAESPVLWLPDVFGYAWALPQLIKQAGLEYFFTIKIGWNQYNRLPYDSFWWQGLDGTRVLTHFSTTTEADGQVMSTYNAQARPGDVLRTWKHFQQKELQDEVFMSFGYGDGGGGPTREMIENLAELAEFPGMPQVRQRAAGDFFRDLERESGAQLPVWNGELYLEYHRGTYTTQGRNKRANRKSEFLLHDAEFLAAYASHLDREYRYPAEAFDQAWRLATLPESTVIERDDGQAVRTQQAEGGTWLDAGELPPYSVTVLRVMPAQPTPPAPLPGKEGGVWLPSPASQAGLWPLSLPRGGAGGEVGIENALLRVEFNAEGDIISVFDKVNRREVLPPGALANQFQAFEDRPKFWDAWDIDIYYDDRMWLADPAESIRVVESGPLRATIEIRRRILNSVYTQRISLAADSPRLDVQTVIDWRERHILLKVAFPVDILAPAATYEIQWGNVQRPTHRNTSWDWARFETCAQKWVDLSEGGYGVSLLNDCKYGHDIKGNVIRLSLLRSPTEPDPEADQGEHRFTYSLYPHAGSWDENTIREAYTLNDPLIVTTRNTERAAQISSLISPLSCLIFCDSPNIVIETIKRAEDGEGLIVRLYESQRRRGEVTLTTAFQLAAVHRTNLLEENQAKLTPQGNRITLFVKPHEIVTLRLV